MDITRPLLVLAVLSSALASAQAAPAPTWPTGYILYEREAVLSPDGTLGFIVPTSDLYEKGERCKLVNVKTGAVIHAIEHGEYWNEGDGGLSHGGLAPRWLRDPVRKDAWLCALEFEGKWQPRNLTLLEIGPGPRFVETDLWALIEKENAKYFRGKIPDKSFNDNYACLLTDSQCAWDGTKAFVFRATADSNPKDIEQDPRYSCSVSFRYDLASRELKLDAGKLEFRKAAPGR